MKFSLSCNVLFVLLTVYQLILCEDWTHSGEDNDEEEEKSKERQEAKSFQIPGILLPWVKTSRQHLSSIPKSLLVQINKNLHTDHLFEAPFFCRVEVVKGMKIIGKVKSRRTLLMSIFFNHNPSPSQNQAILKSTFSY